ncbi:hypothetical protein [Homoserinimonas sp. OAct 916]|uniref:hypothetical protein n=1 Tax=Homoserinimonas sp. OAct 916 TaxID=2211450 RepID=UPI0018E4FBA4|nr:hypothetical protein [Homoserinimonas sp. OAct 916]
MEPASNLFQLAVSVGLPLGIAIVGAFTTYGVARMQIRSRDFERRAERREREKELLRKEAREAFVDRATVIEGIASAIAEYTDVAARNPGTESDFMIRAQLVKLTTRGDAEHLSRLCVGYLQDSRQSLQPETTLETLDDIQRRLEGWHLGHLSLSQVLGHIEDGHKGVRDFLQFHGINPVAPHTQST